MLNRVLGFLAIVMMLATMLAVATPASASNKYPWCALLQGAEGGGGTNCGFVTREQCMATISGIGGLCYENPAYQGAGTRTRKK